MAVGACEAVHREGDGCGVLDFRLFTSGPGPVLSTKSHLRYDLLMDLGFILLKESTAIPV
jgi:hypothetical protein